MTAREPAVTPTALEASSFDARGLYEQPTVWNEPLTQGQAALVEALALVWPVDAEIALDVGCGDGKITTALGNQVDALIVGVDYSRQAVKRAKIPVVLADAELLPFETNGFDLLLSTDMLEHLSDQTKDCVSNEFFRVAKSYVAIAVPYRENLSDAFSRCSNCETIYHLNWHQRAYTAKDLQALAPADWHLVGFILSGESWMQVSAIATDWMATGQNQWANWSKALCPSCGTSGHSGIPRAPAEQDVAKLASSFYEEVERLGPQSRNHTEILALFAYGHELKSAWTISIRKRLESRRLIAELDHCAVNELVLPDNMNGLDSLLVQLPQVARVTRSSDGTALVQSPAFGHRGFVTFEFPEAFIGPVELSVEDGGGTLSAMKLEIAANKRVDIELCRPFQPGIYGVLIRMSKDVPGLKMRIGADQAVLVGHVSVGPEMHYTEHVTNDGRPIWNQVCGKMWLGNDQLNVEVEHRTLSARQIAELYSGIKDLNEDQRWPEFVRLRRELLGRAIEK